MAESTVQYRPPDSGQIRYMRICGICQWVDKKLGPLNSKLHVPTGSHLSQSFCIGKPIICTEIVQSIRCFLRSPALNRMYSSTLRCYFGDKTASVCGVTPCIQFYFLWNCDNLIAFQNSRGQRCPLSDMWQGYRSRTLDLRTSFFPNFVMAWGCR